ncbi:hypothetical protein [Streptacidiphilus sp. PAMC 29251]
MPALLLAPQQSSTSPLPDAVLDVVLRATGPRGAVARSDQRFVRESASSW